MKELKDFIEIKIDSSIKSQLKVGEKNSLVDLDTFYLKCFNVKDHKNITLALRNKYKRMMIGNATLFSKLISDNKKEIKEELNEKEQVDSILEILSISDDIELISFYEKFKEFLLQDIAFKDESFSQKINALDLENLDNNDLEKIIANYIAVFFVSSWMK